MVDRLQGVVAMSLFSRKLTELKVVGLAILVYGLVLFGLTFSFDRAHGVLDYSLGLYGEPDFWVGVITEAHGFLLDLVVVAFLLAWIGKSIERKRANVRYQEEIDDFRPWKTPEASFRIAGCVKRLANEGVQEIDLYECYLKKADFRGLNLTGAKLWGADLGEAVLKNCVLANAKMKGCYLAASRCSGASFEKAFMTNTRCMAGKFSGCNFSGATLVRVNFSGANLRGADLSDADVTDAKFEGANLERADLRGASGLSIEQLLRAGTVRGALLSPDMV